MRSSRESSLKMLLRERPN